MVRLDAGNALYRGTAYASGQTNCFWVYLFATGRTATYLDAIPGPDVVVGHDTALTYITYGSWDHDSTIPEMETPNDFPAYHSFVWFGQRAGFPQVHIRDGRPLQRDLGTIPPRYIDINTGANLILTSPVSLTANACHHVAFTIDWPFNNTFPPGVVKLYIDGVLVATGALPPVLSADLGWNRNPPSVAIGQSRDPSFCTTDGNLRIAQGQLYNHVLTDAQIAALAAQCPWSFAPGIDVHWVLNGAADLIDHVGGNHLAIIGHATTESECPCPGEEEPPPGGGSPPEPPPEEGSPPNPNPDPPPTQGSPGSPPSGGGPPNPGPPNCCYEPNPPGPDNPNPPGPAPGGNPGGNGWEPQCDGGGTVGSYPVADPGESMVGVRDPRLSLEVQWQAFDAENAVTEIPAFWSVDQSIPDPPEYYGGRKEGRLFGISRITRGLSDDQGQYVGSSVDVSLNDKDRAALRTRLGSDTDKYVWEREGIIRIVSEAGRRARVDQRELFRGVSRGINLSSGFKGSIRFEDQLTTQIGKFGPDRTFSTRTFTTGLCAAKDLVGKPMQWIFGEVSDEGAISPVTGLASSRGLVPTWCIGTTSFGGTEYDIYHLAAHACVSFSLYGTDGAEENPSRVLLDLDALGLSGDILTPDAPGWPFTNRYIDQVDPSDGNRIHRVTHFFVRVGSIWTEAHKSGGPSIAANVCGVEDLGDGTGVLITDLFSIYQFVFEHLILPTEEYHTGLYSGSPQWADGRYMVHSDSFAAAQTYSAIRVGGDGYQGGFVLGGPREGPVTLREFLRRASNSGDCWFTWSHGGQLKVVLMDDTATIDDAPIFREPHHLRAMPSPSYDESAIENPVIYQYDYDDDAEKFRVEQEHIDDPIAVGRMGNRQRPSPQPVPMRCTRHADTARDVAQRRLLRRKYPPCYYPVELPLDGIDVEPGDIIRITSQEGAGTGSDERPLFVTEWSYDHSRRRSMLTCRDLTDILAAPALLLSGGEAGEDPLDPDVLLLLDPDDPDVIILR